MAKLKMGRIIKPKGDRHICLRCIWKYVGCNPRINEKTEKITLIGCSKFSRREGRK